MMNYFKKIFKKWRLIEKLEQDREQFSNALKVNDYGLHAGLMTKRCYVNKALNKLQKL